MEDIEAVVIGGGQSGLAAARALRAVGLTPVILEAGDRAVGSWPHYYDSLTLFSPARYNAMPDAPFPGDPGRYPHRDEVVEYLSDYATHLDVDIRTGWRVERVDADGPGFTVHVADGTVMRTRVVVAATGSFGRPYRPAIAGLESFTGTVMHASAYRRPDAFAGQRIVVVGAGNSAVQIGVELAQHADVTLATRAAIRFVAQRPWGKDVHFWGRVSGFDALPIGPWLRHTPATTVLDLGRYGAAVAAGAPDQRPLFLEAQDEIVRWSDGTREHVDTIVLATGYRPHLPYLAGLGALDESGKPIHRAGLSTTHTGLGYVGLDWQRSHASATLRGVGRDAAYVARRLLRTKLRDGQIREGVRLFRHGPGRHTTFRQAVARAGASRSAASWRRLSGTAR